jgi:hypothetical protein
VTHIEKAASYIGRGEEFYRKAAVELTAAREEGYTWKAVAEGVGKSVDWCKALVANSKKGVYSSPLGGEYGRVKTTLTTSMLKAAPMEEIERVIDKLPPERKKQLAAAAGHSYLSKRVEHEEHERNLTERERRERREATERMTRPVREAVSDLGSLTVAGLLEQALEDLNELVADGSLTTRAVRKIDQAYEAFGEGLRMARALVGTEAQ